MQTKIRVYESGRTEQVKNCFCVWKQFNFFFPGNNGWEIAKKKEEEKSSFIFYFFIFYFVLLSFQEYDPDLPPELAAAVGIHDVSAENGNLGRADVGPSDLAKASARVRPPIVCTSYRIQICIFIRILIDFARKYMYFFSLSFPLALFISQ